MTDEEEEPESLVIPYEDSSILLYRAPSIREKQTVRGCVERLAAIFKELIVEEEDRGHVWKVAGGNTTNIIRNLGKGHGLEKVGISMSFSGMRETGATQFSQLFSKVGAYTNGLRKCIEFFCLTSTSEVGWEML